MNSSYLRGNVAWTLWALDWLSGRIGSWHTETLLAEVCAWSELGSWNHWAWCRAALLLRGTSRYSKGSCCENTD